MMNMLHTTTDGADDSEGSSCEGTVQSVHSVENLCEISGNLRLA